MVWGDSWIGPKGKARGNTRVVGETADWNLSLDIYNGFIWFCLSTVLPFSQ